MVGSSLLRFLKKKNFGKILCATRSVLNLENSTKVHNFIKKHKPDVIVNCAGKVGGILANSTYPTEFLNENILIQTNLIKSAYKNNIQHFINLGSSCIYPKYSKQPIKENYLLSGSLEQTNEAYAIAKIAGIKMCESYNIQHGTNFICVMPTNLYGPNDNYDLETSHVLPALLRKMILGKHLQKSDFEFIKSDLEKRPIQGLDHTASEHQIIAVLSKYGIRDKGESVEVEIWGTGTPLREFLHVDDLADALVHLLKSYSGPSHVNIGTGEEISVKDLAQTISLG